MKDDIVLLLSEEVSCADLQCSQEAECKINSLGKPSRSYLTLSYPHGVGKFFPQL
jgi:hypothetical protein